MLIAKNSQWKRAGFTLIIVLALTLGMVLPASAQGLTDVKGHWAENQILSWVEQGLIKGLPDGSFLPDGNVTRAEFIAMVNHAFGYTKEATTAFKDVAATDWFYSEVARAAAVGYIKGDSDGSMRPNSPISRQEAAVIISRILKMDTSGAESSLSFTDAGSLAAWSKSSTAAVVKSGYITGYPDKTFRPESNMTRTEAVTVLSKAAGTIYKTAGVYGDKTGKQTLTGNVTVSVTGVTLQNTVIDGNLYLTEGIGDGEVTLKNVTVKGTTVVSGGGTHSIDIIDTLLGPVTVAATVGAPVRLLASGSSVVGVTSCQTAAILEESGLSGIGFGSVLIPSSAGVSLIGGFGELNVIGSGSIITVSGALGTLTVQTGASGTGISLGQGSTVGTLTLNAAATVSGTGTINTANINVSGSVIAQRPGTVNLGAGVTGTVGGSVVGGTASTPGYIPTAEKTLSGIAITTAPMRTSYVIGQTFDATGMVVTASYSDGSTAAITGYTVAPSGVLTTTNTQVTVTYSGKTATQAITVSALPEQDGTAAKPYLIFTAADLNAMRGGVTGYTGWDMTKAYKLMANIDLSSYGTGEGWAPIGKTDTGCFTGSLDGNGYVINNLYINRPSEYPVGLFGATEGAKIEKVTLFNANITGSEYAGGLVGLAENSTSISFCSVAGEIKTIYSTVGGIAGGLDSSTVTSCYAIVNVSTMSSTVGGIAGYSDSGTIEYSYASCNVTGSGGVGGIVGYNSGTVAETNYVLGGSVTCSDGGYTFWEERKFGRIAGESDGTCGGTSVASLLFYANPIDASGQNFGGMDGANGSDAAASISFTGWNFTDTWTISSDGKPVFKWQKAETAPALPLIRGVSNAGTFYTVSPTWTAETGVTYTATLSKNGGTAAAFTSGTTIDTAGTYLLKLTATRTSNGLSATASLEFVINKDPLAAPTISGVTEGAEYNSTLPNPSFNSNYPCEEILSTDGGTTFDAYNAALFAEVGKTDYVYKVTTKALTYPEVSSQVSFKVNGAGTQTKPFVIYTVADLQAADDGASSSKPAWGYLGAYADSTPPAYYVLENNIDLKDVAFTPLGGYFPFRGIFDGGGHTISNLTIASSDGYIGFFGSNDGTISNLTLANVSVTASFITGGLVGQNGGSISGCTISGSVSGENFIGGLVGINYTSSSLTNSSSSAVVSASGDQGGGSLVGKNGGTIKKCHATGNVSGGIFLGGLVGRTEISSVIETSYATGTVSGTSNLGGLIGANLGSITNCYATGSATGDATSGACVSGLAGSNSGVITKCYASGAASANWNVGGIAGTSYTDMGEAASITKCVALGSVTGSSTTSAVCGSDSGTVSGCLWSLSPADAKAQATYTALEWDFDTVWTIEEGSGYPTLR